MIVHSFPVVSAHFVIILVFFESRALSRTQVNYFALTTVNVGVLLSNLAEKKEQKHRYTAQSSAEDTSGSIYLHRLKNAFNWGAMERNILTSSAREASDLVLVC